MKRCLCWVVRYFPSCARKIFGKVRHMTSESTARKLHARECLPRYAAGAAGHEGGNKKSELCDPGN
jgi:hypothetical protein